MTDVGVKTILLALPVGQPISQDWLDRLNLVCDCTIPITLPSGKNILVNLVLIIIGYTTADLVAEATLSLPLMPIGTQHKIMSLLAKSKKTNFHIIIPIKGCSSFIYCKA